MARIYYVPADDNGAAAELEVRCIEFRPKPRGSMRGFLDVELHYGELNMIFRDCVAHEKDGRSWVNLPAKQFQRGNGTTAYAPLVELDKSAAETFQRVALAALEQHTGEALP